MACAHCNDAGAKRVTLLSGGECCTYCPEWMEECRVRALSAYKVLALDDKDERRKWLANFGAVWGALAKERLEAAVLRIWRARRDAAMSE